MANMSADDIIDRRRLRRKVTFWRIVAVLVLLVAIIGLSLATFGDGLLSPRARPHVAQVRIEGTITEDEALLDLLKSVEESANVAGVILTVDSPGGTTAGGEAIFEAVRDLAEAKPVVAQVGTLAASAGYMIAVAADHVVARQTSIVGSIGVLMQYPNVAELLDNLGVDVRSIKSAPLKAEPSPFSEPSPGAEEMIRAMIMDSYDWFKDLVQARRPLSEQEVAALADGSIFTGRQALDRKLVDELGGEEVARAWLTGEGVDEDLEIVEWEKREPQSPFLIARAVGEILGLDSAAVAPARTLAERLLLDGLVSVWHVENN